MSFSDSPGGTQSLSWVILPSRSNTEIKLQHRLSFCLRKHPVEEGACWNSVGEASSFSLQLQEIPAESRQKVKSLSKLLGDSSVQAVVTFSVVGPKIARSRTCRSRTTAGASALALLLSPGRLFSK